MVLCPASPGLLQEPCVAAPSLILVLTAVVVAGSLDQEAVFIFILLTAGDCLYPEQ